MATILITGASGFIGKELAKALIKKGHEIVNLDVVKSEGLEVEEYIVDISDPKIIDHPIWKKVDYVYHLAAIANLNIAREKPDLAFEINARGTYHIARACEKNNLPLCYISTCATYGSTKDIPRTEKTLPEPTEIYAQAKFAGEVFAHIPPKWVILRFSTVLGTTMRAALATHIFLTKAMNKETIEISGDGSQRRTWINIKDLIEAVVKVYEKQIFYEVINLGGPDSPSVRNLAEICFEVTQGKNFKPLIKYVPARPGEVDEVVSSEKAKKLLDWKPKYTLKKGLEEIYKEWQK